MLSLLIDESPNVRPFFSTLVKPFSRFKESAKLQPASNGDSSAIFLLNDLGYYAEVPGLRDNLNGTHRETHQYRKLHNHE